MVGEECWSGTSPSTIIPLGKERGREEKRRERGEREEREGGRERGEWGEKEGGREKGRRGKEGERSNEISKTVGWVF